MSTLAPIRRLTVDDLHQIPDDGKQRELVDGQIVEWDVTNLWHGAFIVALSRRLSTFVQERRLGLVVGGDPLVRIQGSQHDVRGPDVALYARGRVPHNLRATAADTAPDFVIEVLSPSDRAGEVDKKIEDWMRTGVPLLWYVNPETGTTMVYHGRDVSRVGADTPLNGFDVLPGFQLRMRDVLDELTALTDPLP